MAGLCGERDSAKMFRAAESCSVCLDAVNDSGERSIAKLKCGHHFHLDCIGSAFNVKGAMQCPNCRHVENGQWLYANGSRLTDDFSFEEYNYEEESAYHFPALLAAQETLNHLEWCPYQHGSLAPGGSSYEHVQFHLPSLRDIDSRLDSGTNRSLPEVVVNVSYNYNDSGGAVSSPPVCPYLDAQARFSQGTDDSRLQPPVGGGPTRPLDPSGASNSGSPMSPIFTDADFFGPGSSIWRPRRDSGLLSLSTPPRADPSVFADMVLNPPSTAAPYPEPLRPASHDRVFWYSETERAHSHSLPQGHSVTSNNYSTQQGHNDMYLNGGGLPVGPCPRPRFTHGQVGTSQSQAPNPPRRSAPIGSNRRSRQSGVATPSIPGGGRTDHGHSSGEVSGEMRRRPGQTWSPSWTDVSLSIRSEAPVPEQHGANYQSSGPGLVPWRRENTSGPSPAIWGGAPWQGPRSSTGLPTRSFSDFIEGHGLGHAFSPSPSEVDQQRSSLFATLGGLDRARGAAGGSSTPHQLHLPTSFHGISLRPR